MAHVSTVTIAASQVPADQTNFPDLLPTPPTDSDIWSDTTPSGGDIRIFASDGTTEWAREIVSFDATAKTCEIWVKVPFLSSSSDTEIQIHADGASSDYAVTATYGRNAVWSDYHYVAHLESSGEDSTGNTASISGSGSPTHSAGTIGDGSSGDSSNYYEVPSGTYSVPLMLQVWGEAGSSTSSLVFVYLGNTSNNARHMINVTSGNDLVYNLNNGSSNFDANTGLGLTPGSSRMLHAVARSSTDRELYLDGSSAATSTASATVSGVNALRVHSARNFGDNSKADEVRLRYGLPVDVSSWITTEYNNQSAPNTFATWVDEAAVAVPVLGAITATATTANSISFSIPVAY